MSVAKGLSISSVPRDNFGVKMAKVVNLDMLDVRNFLASSKKKYDL